MDIEVIWVRREREYFFSWDWTGQITLIRLNNLACARKRLSPNGAIKKSAPQPCSADLAEGVTRLLIVGSGFHLWTRGSKLSCVVR